MKKILEINSCNECPHCEHDDYEFASTCIKLQRELKDNSIIPEDCPLETKEDER